MERFAEFPPSPSRPIEKDNSSPTSNITRPMISRSESNPHTTTTFVQADSATFKQVVQMLTGSVRPPPPDPASKGHSIPPIRTGQKKQGFKLYERRNSLKYGLTPLLPNLTRNIPEILSPSMLDFTSLALMSPVTQMSSEEEKAIAQKGFYLHPSPRREKEPRLLPLFPVTSPTRESSSDLELNLMTGVIK